MADEVDLSKPEKKRVLGLQDKMTFGRHAGSTVAQVLKSDPKYLIWAHEKVSWFDLDEDILFQAQEKVDTTREGTDERFRRTGQRSYHHTDYDEGESDEDNEPPF